MENNPPIPTPPTEPAATPSAPPSSPPNPVSSRKVIRPVSDMSEYANPAPTPGTEPAKPAVDTSKIYPAVPTPTPPPSTSIAPPATAAPTESLDPLNQRVAARVPLLQVYAFAIIIYGGYSLLSYVGVSGFFGPLSPVWLIVFGVAALNVGVGVYLLFAKNIQTVNSLLTALLIIGGLGVLNTLVTLGRYFAHLGATTVASLVIPIGLLVFLWNVKSQVDLASVRRS